ncbi:MAG: Zn-ribbon containing protein [Nanoarchaeota archaeon]
MPYKCVNCSKVYLEGSKEVLSGCSECKRKFFFYIKEDQLKKMDETEKEELELSTVEKKQIEEDIREIAGFENDEDPIFLDFESIKVVKSGKYLVDLGNLFSIDKPRVYKLEDGKYIIDLNTKTKKTF